MTNGKRVDFPLFEIYKQPSINISQVKHRRFNLIDREMPVGLIVEELLKSENIKLYIYNFVKNNKRFDNIRVAIKDVAPSYEIILDKYIVLK